MAALTTVQNHLGRLQRGYQGLTWLAGLALAFAAFLWVSLVFVLLDLLVQLSTLWCWLGWGVLLGAGAAVLVGLARQLRRPLGPENVSARVERLHPQLGNRLINVVQFARSEEASDREFAHYLLREGDLDLDDVSARRLFPANILKLALWAPLVGLLLTLVPALLSPRGYATSMTRLLLPMAGVSPFSLTKIVTVEPGDAAIVRGKTLQANVVFDGLTPEQPLLLLKTAKAGVKTLALMPVPEQERTFTARTPALYETADYWIEGGDAHSRRYSITVSSPPALESWEAQIEPPAYTGLEPFELNSELAKLEVPAGATVSMKGLASQPLDRVEMLQDKKAIAAEELGGKREFRASFTLNSASPLAARLVSSAGLEAEMAMPFVILRDQVPNVEFQEEKRRLLVERTAAVPLGFRASDDYGLRQVFLEKVDGRRGNTVVATKEAGDGRPKQLEGGFVVMMTDYKVKPGTRLTFRFGARDDGPEAETRAGYSKIIEIVVPLPEENEKKMDDARQQSEKTLAALISMQQENLKLSRGWRQELGSGRVVADDGRQALLTTQVKIRQLAVGLLEGDSALGDVANILAALVDQEMRQAVAALETLVRAPAEEQQAPLDQAIKLEERILAVLRGMPKALEFESQYQDKTDLLSLLQGLVRRQAANFRGTQKASAQDVAGSAVAQLVAEQDDIADLTAVFLERAAAAKEGKEGDDFAEQIGVVHAQLTEAGIYEKMLTASEQLQQLDWPAATQTEEECLKVLMTALDTMNQWRVKKARESIADAAKTLRDIAEKLEEMEDRQEEIVEVTKDLTKRDKLDQEVRDVLGEMDEEQKEWQKKLEDMAQDLYQFPELPVSNDLNSKMREVFEDVEQAANSEEAPTVEIAVQKEESLLDAIKNTKERVEDVEMWLPDVPDNVKWDLESFDASEFPEIPLVELPEELEDIVGDLLDQSEDIDEKSQDSTGNQIVADGEMGWGVADGPMPSFAAKGKSGNAKPNDNEMTGRSGAGREGQATGELVENKVKGLEGRETHARKTNDPFQKGQVEEEEGSTLDAKATGGGKLGGESERDGMFGEAPRRDLHMQPGEKMRELRQETEALYAKARMLYLGNTKALGAAAVEMRRVERMDKEMKSFTGLNQRVIKRLKDSYTELSTGVVLPVTVHSGVDAGGASAVDDAQLSEIQDEFRDIVADYYKSLSDD